MDKSTPQKHTIRNTRIHCKYMVLHCDSKNVGTSILSDYSHISPKESSEERHGYNLPLAHKR